MKKLILITVILFFQYFIVEGQHLGIKGGPDILSVKYNYNGEPKNSNPQMGFHLGMALEFQLSNSLAFGTGAIFSEKGFQEDYLLHGKDKTTFFYLDIPALFVYKIQAGSNNLYFHAGPYLGLGLFTNLTGESFEMEKGFGDEPAQYHKYDLGLDLGAGIAFDIWRFGLSYNVGLFDIRNADDISVKNRVLGIDVAYMFGQH